MEKKVENPLNKWKMYVESVKCSNWRNRSSILSYIEAFTLLCLSDTGKKFVKEYQFIPTISLLSEPTNRLTCPSGAKESMPVEFYFHTGLRSLTSYPIQNKSVDDSYGPPTSDHLLELKLTYLRDD